MKDPIIQEIRRHRAEYAKRFSYDIRAMGEDIRRCEAVSGGKFAAEIPRGSLRLRRKAPKASAEP